MIIQPNETKAVAYIYNNKTEKEWKQCSFRYRFNNETEWRTITDTSYPFEFSIPLPKVTDRIHFEIKATGINGGTIDFPVGVLNN